MGAASTSLEVFPKVTRGKVTTIPTPVFQSGIPITKNLGSGKTISLFLLTTPIVRKFK